MRKVLPLVLAMAFFAVLLRLLAGIAWTTSRGAAQMPLYSAYRYDPYGTAALDRFLRATGHHVILLTHPILPARSVGTLINLTLPSHAGILESYSTSGGYNPELLRWIAAGNTLMDFTQNKTALTRHFRIRVLGLAPPPSVPLRLLRHKKKPHPARAAYLGAAIPPKWLRLIQAGAGPHRLYPWITTTAWHIPAGNQARLSPWRRQLQLLAPAELQPAKGNRHWAVLARTKRGPAAIERPFGKGRIILIGSPWPALNGGVARVGNLDFLLALISKGPVILNQWSLGVGDNFSTWHVLRRNGLAPAVLELMLLLVAYAWSRRGRPHPSGPRATSAARSSVEQIVALGRLYQAAMPEAQIADQIQTEIRRRLAHALRCRPEEIPARASKESASIQKAVAEITGQLQTIHQMNVKPRLKCPLLSQV